ncbi:helix-turn-helix domain-containing protein [Pseudorhodoferax sp. Leaf267]|uniref:helix-turn-helix domain-containing protein n=1 Tax=Pseudorhodoferax sp. Leaf267 TaxID=1736316 RepID=UPI0019106D2A|nr:helix-turn-helix domain-containing protein [Pseudorhodoferax sp. Leaf267]
MQTITADHAAVYQARRSTDVDEHATHISSWRQEYDQLSCGHFTGLVRELWLGHPRLQVFHEFTGQQTAQRCRPWPGSIWFGIPDGISEGALHFSGRLQGADRPRTMMVARADAGFVLRTPKRFGIYGVVLDEAWLAAQCEALGRGPLVPQGVEVCATALPPHRHVALCQTIESMLSLGAGDEAHQHWGRRALQMLGAQLLQLMADCHDENQPQAAKAAAQRRLALVMAARDMAIDPFNHAMSVDDLCQRLHLTPRTLHNHFLATVGTAPADFLRTVRLNACRRELRQAGPGPVHVQDVAAQWGFFHMGRFSQAYKALFDELPSQTLRQSQLAAFSA